MKEKPILFNTQMVRAILDGRKTQTRRVIKDQHLIGKRILLPRIDGQFLFARDSTVCGQMDNVTFEPRYQIGDILSCEKFEDYDRQIG